MSEELITNEKLFHLLVEIKQQQHEVLEHLKQIRNNMAALDDQIVALQLEITNNTTVEQSALTLISGLVTQLAAALAAAAGAGATPAQLASLQAVHDALVANDAGLAAAVQANTPVAPGNAVVLPPDGASATKPLVK